MNNPDQVFILQPQEIPYDHVDSCCMFDAKVKLGVVTQNAVEKFGHEIIT